MAEEMAQISEMPEDEALKVLMSLHHVDEPEARFMFALSRGEISGDVLDLTKDEPA
jgi:hypothetical protein